MYMDIIISKFVVLENIIFNTRLVFFGWREYACVRQYAYIPLCQNIKNFR